MSERARWLLMDPRIRARDPGLATKDRDQSLVQVRRRASRYLSPRSCGRRLSMAVRQLRLYDGVTHGIEGDGANRRPVARVARPALRVEFASPKEQGMSYRQNCVVVASMTLRRADKTNPTVTMVVLLPYREASQCAGLPESGRIRTALARAEKHASGCDPSYSPSGALRSSQATHAPARGELYAIGSWRPPNGDRITVPHSGQWPCARTLLRLCDRAWL